MSFFFSLGAIQPVIVTDDPSSRPRLLSSSSSVLQIMLYAAACTTAPAERGRAAAPTHFTHFTRFLSLSLSLAVQASKPELELVLEASERRG